MKWILHHSQRPPFQRCIVEEGLQKDSVFLRFRMHRNRYHAYTRERKSAGMQMLSRARPPPYVRRHKSRYRWTPSADCADGDIIRWNTNESRSEWWNYYRKDFCLSGTVGIIADDLKWQTDKPFMAWSVSSLGQADSRQIKQFYLRFRQGNRWKCFLLNFDDLILQSSENGLR